MSLADGGKVLVLGYGNPGRQDDGLGAALVASLEADPAPGVTAEADYQLNIEDAATLAQHDAVLFVDAAVEGPEPYDFRAVEPAAEIAFTSHSVSPESVLAIAEESFGARRPAWVLAIRGYTFEFEEGLSPRAQANLDQAAAFVRQWVRTWRE